MNIDEKRKALREGLKSVVSSSCVENCDRNPYDGEDCDACTADRILAYLRSQGLVFKSGSRPLVIEGDCSACSLTATAPIIEEP